jgi:hypothetical protein
MKEKKKKKKMKEKEMKKKKTKKKKKNEEEYFLLLDRFDWARRRFRHQPHQIIDCHIRDKNNVTLVLEQKLGPYNAMNHDRGCVANGAHWERFRRSLGLTLVAFSNALTINYLKESRIDLENGCNLT